MDKPHLCPRSSFPLSHFLPISPPHLSPPLISSHFPHISPPHLSPPLISSPIISSHFAQSLFLSPLLLSYFAQSLLLSSPLISPPSIPPHLSHHIPLLWLSMVHFILIYSTRFQLSCLSEAVLQCHMNLIYLNPDHSGRPSQKNEQALRHTGKAMTF